MSSLKGACVECEPKGYVVIVSSTQIIGVGLGGCHSRPHCSPFPLPSPSVAQEREIELAACFRNHQTVLPGMFIATRSSSAAALKGAVCGDG